MKLQRANKDFGSIQNIMKDSSNFVRTRKDNKGIIASLSKLFSYFLWEFLLHFN